MSEKTPLLVALCLLFILRYNQVTRWLIHCYHSLRHCRGGYYDGGQFAQRHSKEALCAQIDAVYWRKTYGIEAVVDARRSCGCFNCILARGRYALTRSRLYDYMQHLNEGGGTRLEQWVWRHYAHRYHLWPVALCHELGGHFFLPRWLIVIVDLYNNIHLRMLVSSVLVYACVLLTAHLWIGLLVVVPSSSSSIPSPPPPPRSPPPPPPHMIYNKALQRDVYDCNSVIQSRIAGPSYCVTQRGRLWQPIDYTDVDYTGLCVGDAAVNTTESTPTFMDIDLHPYDVYWTLRCGGGDANRRRRRTLVGRHTLL